MSHSKDKAQQPNSSMAVVVLSSRNHGGIIALGKANEQGRGATAERVRGGDVPSSCSDGGVIALGEASEQGLGATAEEAKVARLQSATKNMTHRMPKESSNVATITV